MNDDEFDAYVEGRSSDQAEALRQLRLLIRANAGSLDEQVATGRWLTGFVFYSADGQMIHAIGPKGKTKTTLHMMPYYGSPTLRERHGDALAPFVTGKSCITFSRFAELPLDALTDIIRRGTPVMVAMLDAHARATEERPKKGR